MIKIYIDSALKFEKHIVNKVKLSNFRLKKLYNLKNILTSDSKLKFCNALILSLFDYGDIVYGNTLSFLMKNTVQKVQNSCMRLIYNIPYRNHILPYLNQYKILNMEYRRLLHMYTFIWRILSTSKPNYLRSKLITQIHHHNTRHIGNFLVKQHKTAIFQKSFSYLAPRLWNELDNDTKYFSHTKFTKTIKNMLLLKQNE